MCTERMGAALVTHARAGSLLNGCQRGLTLIELVVFIVVVSVGLAGILSVLNFTNRDTVNPMLLKQQVAIAESLLEEIESKPFTFCDPDDAHVETATAAVIGTGAGACATLVQDLTPNAGENRYNPAAPFDNVGDYGGFQMSSGIRLPTSAATIVTGLDRYTASVAISQAGTAMGLADDSDALRIDVTVGAPSLPSLTLTGYRFRYAPNSP